LIKWADGSYIYAIVDNNLLKEHEGNDLSALTNLGDKNQFYSSTWIPFFIYKPKKGEYNYEI
jgi:hypothetical protein